VTGWLADFFRFWWGLLYWNTRKGIFRLQPARFRCPCQSPSDSGRAGETRCEAAMLWNRPERFRHLCPLLVATPDGLRCSADTHDVRPFWGRAAVIVAGTAFCLYLAGTVALFGLVRAVGYPVSYWSVVVPFKWREIARAQETVYARLAQKALAEGNFQGAVLALNRVCELNPANYSAAVTLANLLQISNQPGPTDKIFERLLATHPAERPQTAQLWYRVLLSRGDFPRIKQLALHLLAIDDLNRGAWLHALFFALRQAPEPTLLAEAPARLPGLPDWCRHLMTIELALQEKRKADALALLLRPGPAPAQYAVFYHVDRLTEIGRYEEARQLLDLLGRYLGPDETVFLRLNIFGHRGWKALTEAEFDAALQQLPLNARTIPQFCAFLIRHRNPTLLARLHARVMAVLAQPSPELYPALNALFCACAANDDWARLQATATAIKQLTHSDSRTLDALEKFFRSDFHTKRIDMFLISLPLPTDVIYALYERFSRGSPP
jgi:tetratricopeptide (TPR) repeat protein